MAAMEAGAWPGWPSLPSRRRTTSVPSPSARAWLWQQEQEPNDCKSKHRGVFVEAGQEPEAMANQEGPNGWPKLGIGWIGLGLNSPLK